MLKAEQIVPIIREASKSVLGIISLLLILGTLSVCYLFSAESAAYKLLAFGVLFAGIITYTYSIAQFSVSRRDASELLDDKVMKLMSEYPVTEDTLTDLEMFVAERRNIMDPSQLAAGQLQAFQIFVVAPEPLETWNEEVFQSTIRWLQQHKSESDAFIEYWITSRFGDKPPLLSIVSRLVAEEGTRDILDRIRCVSVPDEILFIDFTVWRLPAGKIRAFANDKDKKGKQYRLWELSPNTSNNAYQTLQAIRDIGETASLQVPSADRGHEAEKTSISCLQVRQIPRDFLDRLSRGVSGEGDQ